MLKDKEGKSLYGQLSDCAVVLAGQVAFGRKTKKNVPSKNLNLLV